MIVFFSAVTIFSVVVTVIVVVVVVGGGVKDLFVNIIKAFRKALVRQSRHGTLKRLS